MLNIIGHKSIPTQSEIIQDKCECCGTYHSVNVLVYQKYVFWGPDFYIDIRVLANKVFFFRLNWEY
jgi:hypothetical protein